MAACEGRRCSLKGREQGGLMDWCWGLSTLLRATFSCLQFPLSILKLALPLPFPELVGKAGWKTGASTCGRVGQFFIVMGIRRRPPIHRL